MTHPSRLRIALALVTGLPACALARQAPASMDAVTCGAVAAAIDSLVIGSRAARVGLLEHTIPRSEAETARGRLESIAELPGLDATTLRSFRENNARARPACETLSLVGGVTHVRARELDALPDDAEGYWRTLHARYPGVAGVTSTSGVGIGRDGKQALLMLDHACGGVCGARHIVLLERDDAGTWRVARAVLTWIS